MKVKTVQFRDCSKRYRLVNGKVLDAHRFACLGPRDDVIIRSKANAVVRCRNGRATLLPAYLSHDHFVVGRRRVRVTVKEITTKEESSAYEDLTRYHYRGKKLHGRHAPLILVCHDPLLPPVLGYIELATPFLMNKPRTAILNAPFRDDQSNVTWTSWSKSTAREYTNLVVRIARTVVSPEFRGLGLATILVKHAARFARKHWHVGGLRPLFLEITADMLRYVPFVERAGMHYIGQTEGNLARVTKDMAYILGNLQRVQSREILTDDSGGIVDLQISYANQLATLARRNGLSHNDLLQLLLKHPHRLTDDAWTKLHKVYRMPKPTYLLGLTQPAASFLRRRIKDLDLAGNPRHFVPDDHQGPPEAPLITLRKCSLTLSASSRRTRSTRRVQEAFGVEQSMLTQTLFSGLSLRICAGDIVLICGPSGAGKTSLLSLLRRRVTQPNRPQPGLRGKVWVRRGLAVSTLGPPSQRTPLIDSLNTQSFDRSLYALNISGLAEAHLYLRRFAQLSNGQQYRAMVANLISTDADVWIADEFCATLDPVTASIVARNLRRCAKRLNVTVLLAAASWSDFIHELEPDIVVHLRSPWDTHVFDWPTFEESLETSALAGLAQPFR